jgi:hypothetical protein
MQDSRKIASKIVGVSLGGHKEHKEVIIPENVVLPDDAPARMKTLRAEGKKWYLTVVYKPDTEVPFALFCHTNNHDKSAQTYDAVERLLELAAHKGIAERFVGAASEKMKYDPNTGKITRVISMLLRHGVLIENIVAELDKMQDIYAGSFLFHLKKFLSNYIMDGAIAVGNVCPECDTTLVYSEGCFKCPSCGHSKCG